jgi:hypothetical protein
MIRCEKCSKPITDYKDSKLMIGKKWHSKCFSCGKVIFCSFVLFDYEKFIILKCIADVCSMPLSYGEFNVNSNRIFCQICNLRQHGPKDSSNFMSAWQKKFIDRAQKELRFIFDYSFF